MATLNRNAAQYVRMSTDRQDLSPLVQRDATAKFAAANGMEIISSYEDEGKSGLQLLNRPRLRQLLRDVADSPRFSQILVYDVSRWGRFQDVDAAAYYEYHCRLHGVQVIYVGEQFANDNTPTTVLLKSMRRVMAAEYSRDIAVKSRAGQERVVSMGYQMGLLPAFGYRRCSVSADGTKRVLLEPGQRKIALSDRVEWVLGPEHEQDLVRRLCSAFSAGMTLEELAGLATAEGWRSRAGKRVTPSGLRALLSNEVLIGNFVWGRLSKGGKVLRSDPTRLDGCVPRIIDDETWQRVQDRLRDTYPGARPRPTTVVSAATARGAPKQLSLSLRRTDADDSYRRKLGGPAELRGQSALLGRTLCAALLGEGVHAAFDTRNLVISFWNARIRVRLSWPQDPSSWLLERSKSLTPVSEVVVIRMAGLDQPLDYFLVPAKPFPPELLALLPREVPRPLVRYRCSTREDLIRRLSLLSVGNRKSAGVSRSRPVVAGDEQ